MAIGSDKYKFYVDILKEEMLPAFGCTEPIAVAFAAAKARELLGIMPNRIVVQSSGNIIKNVMGVIVPGTGNMRGMDTAAVLGAVAGDSSLGLEVLSQVTTEDIALARQYLRQDICDVQLLSSKAKLHLILTAEYDGDSALVEIVHTHTGIVRMERGGQILLNIPFDEKSSEEGANDRGQMNLDDILNFAREVELDDVRDLIRRQIEYNSAISDEGLSRDYGANIGSTLIENFGADVNIRARAAAAAGSDARMNGCEMPVVINSGSGNQGLTVSLPVIIYAKELGSSEEKLYRALVLSNLTAIRQKTNIGRLSAYCGAVCAAAGAGAGITYLSGGSNEQILYTITNTLANVSGVVCDGAKPSCAAKIASCVDAAILAHAMSMANRVFQSGEGLVKSNTENTINSIGQMAREGMEITDEVILKIMVS